MLFYMIIGLMLLLLLYYLLPHHRTAPVPEPIGSRFMPNGNGGGKLDFITANKSKRKLDNDFIRNLLRR